MHMRILFFIVFCFTRSVISSDACCDYIFDVKGGATLRDEYRCCFKHENDTCFDHRERWVCFSCMQIATWTIGPCVCSLIDNNSCCYINYCPATACEFVSKQCLELSLVECALALSPCITQNFYDKARSFLKLKKTKPQFERNKISSQSTYSDIPSRTKIPSKSNTKNITQNNQKIQKLTAYYSQDTDYGSFTSRAILSSQHTIHPCKSSIHKRDDSSDSSDSSDD